MNLHGTQQLETSRFILRKFTRDDAVQIYENWANDDEVTKYLTWKTYKSTDDAYWFLDNLCDYSKPDCYQWAIVLKDTNEVIGSISALDVNTDVASCSLGWAIGRKYWGKGYMPECAKEVIRFLFESEGFNRVCALHDAENEKSGRVMVKCGMKYEGCLRASDRNNTGIADMKVYSLLKSEFYGNCEAEKTV